MSLLLLPEPPSELSLHTFKAAYGPGLQQVLTSLSRENQQKSVRLIVALHCNSIPSVRSASRASNFAKMQELLRQFYTLVAAVLAEWPPSWIVDALDVRVLIIYTHAEPETKSILDEQGPTLPLGALANINWPLEIVYSLDGEPGEALLQNFMATRRSVSTALNLGTFPIRRVAGGLSIKTTNNENDTAHTPKSGASRYHQSVAVGGTFDHLHLGHKLLLTAAALVLDPQRWSIQETHRTLTIGITTSKLLLNKAYASVLESWSTRQEAVIQFLLSILFADKISLSNLQRQEYNSDPIHGTAIYYILPDQLLVRCVEIDDAYGPTITDENIDALVVSAETRKGGAAVNEKRKEKGWRELNVYEVGVLDSKASDEDAEQRDDFASKISSSEIRKRIVESQGAS